MVQVVKYSMWEKINNLGDQINANLIHCITGMEPFVSTRGEYVVGIGSILQKATPRSHVWGSGLMHRTMVAKIADPLKIRAVRGRMTKAVLDTQGLLNRAVPLGDPGFLVARYYDRLIEGTADDQSMPEVCIVPHHASFESPAFDLFRDQESYSLIDMRTRDMNVLRRIRGAKVVISQSLHGLVFAEAFGIPSVWISRKNDEDWTFKFKDWYSLTDYPETEPVMFSGHEPLAVDKLRRAAKAANARLDVDGIEAEFPSACFDEVPDDGFVDFRSARSRSIPLVKSDILADIGGREIAALSDDEIISIERSIKTVFTDTFKNWAEKKYAIIGSKKIDDDDSVELERIMDRLSGVQFAFLVIQDGQSGNTKRNFDVLKADGRVGDTIMIRPSGELSLRNGRAATIVIR